eukprot:gene26203-11895_t
MAVFVAARDGRTVAAELPPDATHGGLLLRDPEQPLADIGVGAEGVVHVSDERRFAVGDTVARIGGREVTVPRQGWELGRGETADVVE